MWYRMYAYQHGALALNGGATMGRRLAPELLQACCGAFVTRHFLMQTPFFLPSLRAYFPSLFLIIPEFHLFLPLLPLPSASVSSDYWSAAADMMWEHKSPCDDSGAASEVLPE